MTFYFAGVSALIVNNLPWKDIAPYCAFLYVSTCLDIAIILFVLWQLRMRAQSSVVVSACDILRLQWFTQSLDYLNTSPSCYKGILMPRFLRDEVSTLSQRWLKQSMLIAIPIILMGAWHVLLLYRVASCYPAPRPSPYDFTCIMQRSNAEPNNNDAKP